ncbi:protein kinase, partial [Acinetobacter baumannii]
DVSRGPGGSVFRATHLGLMIPVVVKVIPTPTAGDRGVTDHLKREAQLLAKLNHPNIIRVWDFQEDQGFAYLVLEQPTGPSLTELLRTEGRLRP